MSTKNSRVEWVDIIKFICIMWVMLSHLESQTAFLKAFYTPFFLNGFFFASGYVYRHKDDFKTFFIKKVKGLLWPWLFFSMFDILLSHVISFNNHEPIMEEIIRNLLQIRGRGDGLWFVAALFVAFIPFYFFIKKYEETSKTTTSIALFVGIAFALSMLSAIYANYMDPTLLPWGSYCLPWHVEYIFIAMFWMALGYFFKQKFEEVYDKQITVVHFIVAAAVYLLIIYIPFFGNYEINGLGGILYKYIKEILGVFSLIYISKRIKPNKFNLFVGQNTIIYFALHGKVYSLLQTVIKKLFSTAYASILSNTVTSSIFAIMLTIVLAVILIVPAYIINRFFPILVGRTKKK